MLARHIHAIDVVSSADIVDLLRRNGKGDAAAVPTWFKEYLPNSS
jgi:hypothetical protein